MDIFEQLESAHVITIGDDVTTDFGWNADDEPEDWCVSAYVRSELGYAEYYWSHEDFTNAVEYGDGFKLPDGLIIEFQQLINVVNAV